MDEKLLHARQLCLDQAQGFVGSRLHILLNLIACNLVRIPKLIPL
jgi:hypothetical protein